MFQDNLLSNEKMQRIMKENLPLKFDICLCRGLCYYTGIIFEVVLSNQKTPSIAGGGRYDDLCGIPCVGFSLGIDRILDYVKLEKKSSIKVWVFRNQ